MLIKTSRGTKRYFRGQSLEFLTLFGGFSAPRHVKVMALESDPDSERMRTSFDARHQFGFTIIFNDELKMCSVMVIQRSTLVLRR